MRPCGRKRAGQERRAHLIDEDHGEGGRISVDPLPSDVVGSPCRPSIAGAGRNDLVGAGGSDQGKECEERTHVEARYQEGRGRQEGGK